MSEERSRIFGFLGILAFFAFLAFLGYTIWSMRRETTLTTAEIERAREIVRRLESAGQ